MQITKPLKRRALIKKLGLAAAASSTLALTGCGSGGSSGSSASSGNSASSTGGSSNNSTNTTQWLSGGTDAMEVTFPPTSDPLDLSLGNVICTNTGTRSYTLGPCYFPADDYRSDISEGEPGVPMTLAMKLIDADCNPIVGADIEVWWCNWEGIYSGNDTGTNNPYSFSTGFCTSNDADALQAKWFRGVQTTDSEGNVYFLGCFPGWYPSRTTHIHFRVVINNVERLVSQFCFDDDLCDDIYLSHSDYTGTTKDTRNSTDNVFSSDFGEYQFIVERQSDGSMLAYKAIQLI
ncbi:dioxygenase family protein [Aurantivibrio plasticivorans]